MASNVPKTPFIRFLNKRKFATAAQPATKSVTDIQVTSLPNKLVVASSKRSPPGLAQIAVGFKAGSRYEGKDNAGASYLLRASVGLSTKGSTQFLITRKLQSLGASLSATSDRETMVYTLQSTVNNLEESLKLLKTVVAEQAFKPWDLSDNVTRVKYELGCIPPEAVLLDLLHQSAYKQGLGNSMFVKKHNIKKIGSETLQHFVGEHFVGSKGAVAGVGVDHQDLIDFANLLNLEANSPHADSPASPSKYRGGEIRRDANLPNAYVAIAGEAPSLQKKEVYAWAVLAEALGGSSSIKRGDGTGPLGKAIKNMNDVSVGAVAALHSDSGLLAIALQSQPQNTDAAVKAILQSLKSGVTDDDVKRGKAKLMMKLLEGADSSNCLLTEMIQQSLLMNGAVSTPEALAQAVSDVTSQQVQQALSKLACSPKSMAALGNLSTAPFIDELQ